MSDKNYYEALARDVNLESITSSERNALILEKLRNNDESLKRMGIIVGDDEEYWPGGCDFDIQEGDDLGWLGYFIGKSKELESLIIYHLPGDKSLGQGLAQNQSIQEIIIESDLGKEGFQTLAPFFQNTNTLEELDFSTPMSITSLESAQSIALLLNQCQIRSLKKVQLDENAMSDEEFEAIARSLRAQPQLEELTLFSISREDAPFGRRGYAALGATMKNWTSPSLVELVIYKSDLDDEGLLALVEGMANCVNLEHLDLNACGRSITVVGLTALSSLFRSKKFYLESLDLSSMGIDNDGMIALATGLAAFQSLKSFNISYNAIGDEGLKALAIGLSNHKNLVTLHLSHNGTLTARGGEGMTTLATVLTTFQSLNTLDLSHNTIGDEGLQSLVVGLSNNNYLESLNLWGSGPFSQIGLRRLSDAIPTMFNLRELYLVHNAINDEGLQALAVGLTEHPALERLTLASNAIGSEGLRAFAATKMTSLRRLFLANNAINDDALGVFVEGIENFVSLETLNLANNNMITSSGMAVLTPIFRRESCSLKEIDLNPANLEDSGARAFAEALVDNQSLERLFFSYANLTALGWAAFSTLLCDTSSANNTYLSNHTLEEIGSSYYDPRDGIPSSVKQYLELNRQTQYDVPICKILMSHSDLDMTPLLQWKLKLLPFVLAWFERAQSCRTYLGESITSFERRELSALYQFIRGLPLLAASGFYKQMSTDAHSKKRKFDVCDK